MSKHWIGSVKEKRFTYELNHLTRHAAILGTTGSGKTVMCKILIEEALQKGIPVIAIDPKGDIGSLSIVHPEFDFRPFVTKQSATKVARQYSEHLVDSKSSIKLLQKTETTIYTPKSNVGKQVNLLPDLTAPKGFKKMAGDYSIVADFVEPVSESVLQLAGLKTNRERVQTIVSQLLIHHWNKGNDLTIPTLIEQIIEPPFNDVGSLPLQDFLGEKERMKAASQINLLLSSPSKRAWSQGESLNIKDMMSKGRLSVFDLRHTGNIAEKQFVVEQLLQEIYRFLIEKGGTERLKYILYIDELLGLLPPPPANPPSKKLLELLIRQARAFGLGIILATQSPGDIDYKIFGNIGSRFVGRLRTENDIEKVATAMDLTPSVLKRDVSKLKTGGFILNNAVTNKTVQLQARWLYSYHGGPLKGQEVHWINHPESKPKQIKLSIPTVQKRDPKEKAIKKKRVKRVSTEQLIRSAAPKRKKAKKKITKRVDSLALRRIIQTVKRNTDETTMLIAPSVAKRYVPHLRLTLVPKRFRGIEFPFQGPYIFDLTAKLIPIDNYLKRLTWSQLASYDIEVLPAKRSILEAINYSLRDAKPRMREEYFESTILSCASTSRDELVRKNQAHTMKLYHRECEKLDRQFKKLKESAEKRIKSNKERINAYRWKIVSHKTKRAFTRAKHADLRTKQWGKRVLSLQKDSTKEMEHVKKKRAALKLKKARLKERTIDKAYESVRKRAYAPSNKDILIKATILLVPARPSRV